MHSLGGGLLIIVRLGWVQAAAQQTAAILEVARVEAEDLQACLQHEQVGSTLWSSAYTDLQQQKLLSEFLDPVRLLGHASRCTLPVIAAVVGAQVMVVPGLLHLTHKSVLLS